MFSYYLFKVKAFKRKWKPWAGQGVLKLGNLGEKGPLAVWEIQQSEWEGGGGGQKLLPSIRGGCIFSGITHSSYA